MSALEFSAIVFAVSAVAGFLGSLTGLGGGVVVTPVLTLLLGVDLHYAMGAIAGLGDRHVLRRGGGLRQGRLLQRPGGHVPGDRHHHRRGGRRASDARGAGFGAGRDLRRWCCLFGVDLAASAHGRGPERRPIRWRRA